MGTSASENIALHIASTNDLRAVREAKSETTALGAAAKRATDDAAASQAKLTATTEQVRRAQAAANGDFEKFKQILGQLVQGENSLAKAAAAASDQLRKQSGRVAGNIGPQLGPALPTTRLAEEIEKSNAALTKIPPNVRTAGNSFGLLAAAATTGTGSLSGLTAAAGNVVQGMALMSTNAKLAASAFGIGALTAAIGVLITTALDAKEAIEHIPDGMLNAATQAHIGNLRTVAQIDREIEQTERRRAALAESSKSFLGNIAAFLNDSRALDEQKQREQTIADLGAKINALYARRVSLTGELREKERRAAKEAAEEAKQRLREQTELAKVAQQHLYDLRNAAAVEADKATQTEFEQRRRAIEREAADEIRKNEQLVQSDSLRAQALDAINDKKKYSLQLLQREIDLAKEKQVKEGLQGYAKLSQAATLHGSIVAKVAKAAADAVRVHELYIEGKKDAIKAKAEWSAAMGAFAIGNVVGGGLHLLAAGGYAAAAAAAAAEAGGSLGIGGGGGAGGGGGDSTTFTPNGNDGGAGPVTIVLQTVNPYSKEVLGEAIYQINRAGVLKRPIPIAPTSGLVVAGAA